jgi:hypothetical protein
MLSCEWSTQRCRRCDFLGADRGCIYGKAVQLVPNVIQGHPSGLCADGSHPGDNIALCIGFVLNPGEYKTRRNCEALCSNDLPKLIQR